MEETRTSGVLRRSRLRERQRATGARARRPRGRALGGRGTPPVSAPGRTSRASQARWQPTHDQLELLASLIDAGVTTESALATVGAMAGGRDTGRALRDAADAVRSGSSLQVALAGVGAPPSVVALVSGGERTGRVAAAIRTAADLTGRLDELRVVMRRASVYPAVVLAVGAAMLTLISVTVVPQLERTFLDLGGELPGPTRAVLAISDVLRSLWTPALVVLILLARRPARRLHDAMPWLRVPRRLPVIGRLRDDVDLVVLARLVASLLAAGVTLVDALRAAAEVLPAGRLRERVDRAADEVEAGRSAFSADGLGGVLDRAEREVLAVGEVTGLLGTQWARVAERRDVALRERVVRAGALLEPVLVVIVGATVGGAVMALYLPTFRVLDLL